jgi:hypothetical protein
MPVVGSISDASNPRPLFADSEFLRSATKVTDSRTLRCLNIFLVLKKFTCRRLCLIC